MRSTKNKAAIPAAVAQPIAIGPRLRKYLENGEYSLRERAVFGILISEALGVFGASGVLVLAFISRVPGGCMAGL